MTFRQHEGTYDFGGPIVGLGERTAALVARLTKVGHVDTATAWEALNKSVKRDGAMRTEAALEDIERIHKSGKLKAPAAKVLPMFAATISADDAVKRAEARKEARGAQEGPQLLAHQERHQLE